MRVVVEAGTRLEEGLTRTLHYSRRTLSERDVTPVKSAAVVQ